MIESVWMFQLGLWDDVHTNEGKSRGVWERREFRIVSDGGGGMAPNTYILKVGSVEN